MRSLKAKKDEEARLQRVNIIVSTIYDRAIHQAKSTGDSRYKYAMPTAQVRSQKHMMMAHHQMMAHQSPIPDENITFHNENMANILSNLRALFPECLVEFKSITMAMGNDGQMHDVSDLDQKALAFVTNPQTSAFIVIDWS